MDEELEMLRARIADLDRNIMELIGLRTELAREIGEIKHAKGLPIRNPEVEKEVVARFVSMANDFELYPEETEALAKILIRQAVKAQVDLIKTSNPRRILVVGGAGKMGRWLFRYFKNKGHDVRVLDPGAGPELYQVENLEEGLKWAEITAIATPISEIPDILRAIVDREPRCLIFDIASIKSPLVSMIKKGVERGLRIGSAHPMFGPDVDSLYDRNIVICDCGCEEANTEIWRLFDDTGAFLVKIPLERHDELMSIVLGLSHAVSLAFFAALSRSNIPYQTLEKVASTTFRKQLETSKDVAFENPELYFDIQHKNPFTKAALSALTDAIKEIYRLVEKGERESFIRLMEEGRNYFGGSR